MHFLAVFLFFLSLFLPFLYLKDLRQYNGVNMIKGNFLNESIKIYRDENNIPHIKAKTLKDSLFGLGYVHAQDRLFSIHMQKVVFSGRLSEFFGRKFLEMDKFMRNILLMRTSIENKEELDDHIKEIVQAYVDGVNSFADSLYFLPTEFWISGLKYEPFTIEDGMTMWKYIGFALTYDWQYEILREKISEIYDDLLAEEMTSAFDHFQFENTVILNDDELKQSNLYFKYNKTDHPQTKQTHSQIHHKNVSSTTYVGNVFHDLIDMIDTIGRGSNSFVIHGNHTKSGKPLLANDPHLDNLIPSIWYVAEIIYEEGKRFVSGATLPGVPFIFIGRTHFFAWGVTALHTDTSDLYREVLSEDGNQYLYDSKYYNLTTIEEVIKIKNEQPYKMKIKKTRHGPILDVIKDMYNIDIGFKNQTLSLAWVGHIKKDTTYKTLYNLYQITNDSSEINKVFKDFVLPLVSIVWATTKGDIGYYAAGWIPQRNNLEKGFFLDGTSKEDDWIGFIENEKTAQIINPKKGYIVTANNKIAGNNIIYHRTMHMLSSPRAFRMDAIISKLIKEGEKLDVEHLKKIQLDVKDPYVEVILPDFIKIIESYKAAYNFTILELNKINSLLIYIKKWDALVDKQSIAASIFNVWEYLFLKSLLGDIDSNEDRERIVFSINFEQFIFNRIKKWSNNLIFPNETWCSSKFEASSFQENICFYKIIKAFLDTYAHLKNDVGNNILNWNWGKIHKMKYRHIPFSETPFRSLFDRKITSHGNRRTINVAIPNLRTKSFDAVHSANMRLIIDMDENGKSYFIQDLGVGENLIGHFYDNWLEKHHNGEYLRFYHGISELKKYTHFLELISSDEQAKTFNQEY